jgi:tetratricopeptide (TPR) repeat protein
VAEAFAQTNRADRARDAYSYILTNCPNPADRLATMQKALPVLPEEMIAALLGHERATEFSIVRDDLARRHIGRAAEDPSLTAAPDEIRRIEALAGASTTADDAILLGFYALRHNDPGKATIWFKTALSRNGGAKAAEGAVLALSAAKDHQQAEELGSQWLQAGAANRKAYLDAATALIAQDPPPRLSEPVIERIAKTITTERYASGAAGLGWYAYNSGQIAASATWFGTALTWDRGQEQAAYGLALTRQRLRDQAGLRAIVAEWGSRSQRIADLLRPIRQTAAAPDKQEHERSSDEPPEAAIRHKQSASSKRADTPPAERAQDRVPERYSAPATRLRATSGSCGGGAAGAAALARGWCLLNLKRPAAAAEAFDAALRTGSGPVAQDAAAGKTYAQIQQGLTAEASVSAASAPVSPARRTELTALILSERFYTLYEARDYNAALLTLEQRARYAPETTDLMMLRGWSYFNLRRYADARRVFRAINQANGSSQAQAGLAAIDDATRFNRY